MPTEQTGRAKQTSRAEDTKRADLETLRRMAEARMPTTGADAAHDFSHVLRVAHSAERIARAEGADVEVCVAAALLHELFNSPKGHPDSALSGDVCAERARELLTEIGWAEAARDSICYAIRVHSFSRGLPAETLEARVLQDADRLDAIGAIGIARCFATCQAMGRPFYRDDDPLCAARAPDDKLWGVDHFYKKLLRLAPGLHTETARALAVPRVAMMDEFLRQLGAEIGVGVEAGTQAGGGASE